jgi:hypothetical protein
MTKVIGMLVALAVFCAMPAVAFAQEQNDNVSSGNTQDADIDQGAAGGDADGGGVDGDGDGSGDDASGGDGGEGGDAGNQAAICQQNAGDDARCDIDQSQNFEGDTFVDVDGDGVDDDDDVHVARGHVGVQGVQGVRLARTGFDAWVLGLVGAVALAGGIGLLAAQRRGRLHG